MINVLWPTIRPKEAYERAKSWHSKRGGDILDASFYFAVNSTEHREALLNLNQGREYLPLLNVSIFDRARPGVCHSASMLSRYFIPPKCCGYDTDIIILASDDYDVPQGWDSYLIEQFKDFDGMLIVNDHKSYAQATNIIPIPICSGAYLKRLNGIFYHPDFHHFFSDQELYYNALEIGNFKDLRGTDEPRFEHKHWSFGGRKKDAFDNRNNTWWNEDKATYERRKKMTLEQRLIWKEEV